ncbi:lysozyme-like protein [Dichomitus squalens]|uniref:Lysozyme-like protein n=1 Tax=Dichomitus squalens TaxID=114155 RepID=A0A4Q9PQ22_9APHY|nr:lysozyme-like protein [Dichomitus squalens]
MKLSTPFILLAAAIGVVEASGHDGLSRVAARHHDVARRNNDSAAAKRASTGRCKVRPSSTLVHTSTPTSTSTSTHASSSTHKTTSTKKTSPTGLTTTSTKTSSGSKSGSNNNSGVTSNVAGLVKVTDWSCGASGASKQITATDGPNGNIDWMNCGLYDGGWNPPHVTVNDVITVDLGAALGDSNTPFKACGPYIDLFYKYAGEHGIPPIIVASIAMQESTCNVHEVGGGGEQGIMQISKDKCGGAPGGNCQDPDFNIRTGVAFFAQTLSDNGGNLLLTLGNYNGWPKGMTVASATAARWTDCCLCQNNLDYLVQYLNGWFLNRDPYTGTPRIGKYFNLDACR